MLNLSSYAETQHGSSSCGLKGLLVHDAYQHMQGREKDVAIFSTVRGGKKHAGIGFVADERRVNVGLTRARSSLIVIGNAKALKSDEVWGNLVKQATVGGSVLHFLLRAVVWHAVIHHALSV